MKTILSVILAAALFIVAVYLYNIELIDIRFEEIDYRIGAIAEMQEVSDPFGFMTDVEFLRQGAPGDGEKFYDREGEKALRGLDRPARRTGRYTTGAPRIAVRSIANAFRFLLRKTGVNPKKDDPITDVLEIGYFCERKRMYSDAVYVYDDVIATIGAPRRIKAAVMVHKAFCASKLGDYDESRVVCEQAITLYPGSDAEAFSWKFLGSIQSMERDRARIDNATETDLEKGHRFYLRGDYRSAITRYSNYLARAPRSETAVRARYFKGRSFEELGETGNAAGEYKKIIGLDRREQWVKPAMRRLRLAGQLDNNRKLFLDEAKRRLEAYKDQVVLANVPDYSKFVSGSSLGKQVRRDEVDSMLGANIITGNHEFRNDNGAATLQQKIDSLRNALLESCPAGREERKNRERWEVLSDIPSRRPGGLRSFIESYSTALRQVFANRARNGAKYPVELLVNMEIKADGSVGAVSVLKSTSGDGAFEQLAVKTIREWKFPAVHDSVGDIAIHYPFVFKD